MKKLFQISILLFISTLCLKSQVDVLTVNLNCASRCFELEINGGYSPYEVKWQKEVNGVYETIEGWPKSNLGGNNGEEDICGIEAATRYKVIVIDDFCGTAELEVYSFDEIVIEEPIITESCISNGSITFGSNPFSGGTSPYTVKWSNNSTTPNQTNLSSGIYTLKVIDYVGCFTIKDYVIDNNIDNSIAEISDHNDECGISLGEFTIDIDESDDNYNPSWTLPFIVKCKNTTTNEIIETQFINSNPIIIDGLEGGYNYNVEIQFSSLCKTIVPVYIHDQPFVYAIAQDPYPFPACEGESNGKIIVTLLEDNGISGADNENYNFSWDDGSDTRFAINLSAGNYCVSITDKLVTSNCLAVNCFDIPEINFGITGEITNPTNCNNPDGSINITISESTYEYNYLWSNGSTNQNLTNLVGGEYCVTVTTDNNCSVSECFEVIPVCCDNDLVVIPIITPGVENGNNPPNGKIDIIVNFGSGNYNYEWYILEGSDYENLNLSGNIQSTLVSGTYKILVSDIETGCEKIKIVTLTNRECQNKLNVFTYSLNDNKDKNCDSKKSVKILFYRYQNAGNPFLPITIECIKPVEAENLITSVYTLNTINEYNDFFGVNDAKTFEPAFKTFEPYIIRVMDGCGFKKEFEVYTCQKCDINSINDSENSNHYIYLEEPSQSSFGLKIQKPCSDGNGGIFGIKKNNKIIVHREPNNYLGYTFTWPNDKTGQIKWEKKNNKWKVKKYGDMDYDANDDYNSNSTLIVKVERSDGCKLDIPIQFNSGAKDLELIRTSELYPNLITYSQKCSNCSSIPLANSLSKYVFGCNGTKNEAAKGPFELYPNDKNNPCKGGGTLLNSYKIIDGVIEENNEILIPPTQDAQNLANIVSTNCVNTQGGGCSFNGEAVYGVSLPYDVYGYYCFLYEGTKSEVSDSDDCKCPSITLGTDSDKNIKISINTNCSLPGKTIEVLKPNGNIDIIKTNGMSAGSHTYIYNTFGIEGIYTFTMLYMENRCENSTIVNQIDTRNDCPGSFDITNFVNQEAHLLIESEKLLSGTLKFMNAAGLIVNTQSISIIKKGYNDIKINTINLFPNNTYTAEITFNGYLCDKLIFQFTLNNSIPDCPKIEYNNNANSSTFIFSTTQEIKDMKVLLFNSSDDIVFLKSFDLRNGQNQEITFIFGEIPKGTYKVVFLNPVGCRQVEFEFKKSFFTDPNPEGDCILENSVDLIYSDNENQFIHCTSESFDSSTFYRITSITDSTFQTISELIYFTYSEVIFKHMRLDEYGNFVFFGNKSDSTFIVCITPDRVVKWQRYIPYFIYVSVPYLNKLNYPIELASMHYQTKIFRRYYISEFGEIVSFGTLHYANPRGTINTPLNVFLHHNNFVSSTYSAEVVVYNTKSETTKTLQLDSTFRVKKILQLESGEYVIAGHVKDTMLISDSIIYDYNYHSLLTIWTDTNLVITKYKIFDTNEDIYFENIAFDEVSKYVITYYTSDTLIDENGNTYVERCEQLMGFEEEMAASGSRIKNNIQVTNLSERPDNLITIYPNPSKSGYTIDIYSEEDVEVELSSINQIGQVIFKDVLPLTKGNNRYYLIESEKWSSGLYYIELKSKSINHTSKLIKIE